VSRGKIKFFNNMKRILSVVAAALMAGSVLVACGSASTFPKTASAVRVNKVIMDYNDSPLEVAGDLFAGDLIGVSENGEEMYASPKVLFIKKGTDSILNKTPRELTTDEYVLLSAAPFDDIEMQFDQDMWRITATYHKGEKVSPAEAKK
jgi:hypothetical protein